LGWRLHCRDDGASGAGWHRFWRSADHERSLTGCDRGVEAWRLTAKQSHPRPKRLTVGDCGHQPPKRIGQGDLLNGLQQTVTGAHGLTRSQIQAPGSAGRPERYEYALSGLRILRARNRPSCPVHMHLPQTLWNRRYPAVLRFLGRVSGRGWRRYLWIWKRIITNGMDAELRNLLARGNFSLKVRCGRISRTQR
jgi:hypothetical protein